MTTTKLVFSQLMDILPLHEFRKCVQCYGGNYKVQSFTCLDQFLCMAFAQLTHRESLRDIEVCLRAMQSKLYHMGIRSRVSRSTLADANENRDWRIYADFAQALISIARPLYARNPLEIDLNRTTYVLDSSVIDLCLSLFPWAHFRQNKAAVKLHTLLDLHGNIPTFIHISEGKQHDVTILDNLIIEPGSFYIMDRGYLDFARLYRIHQNQAYFLIRAKSNLKTQRLYSRPVDKSTGLQCDQTVRLVVPQSVQGYPETLRRIRYYDADQGRRFVFLSNHFQLAAPAFPPTYRMRWQVELFFKWIKQHLRIKKFYGSSENAVKTQIWIAISVYVLAAILKKQLNLDQNLYTILQILGITVFEKRPILQVFSGCDYTFPEEPNPWQLNLFDL
jgi:hypothetical protein